VVFDQKNPDSALLEMADKARQTDQFDLRKPGGGLVKHHHLRIGNQHAAEFGADMAVVRRTMARLNFDVPLVGSNGTLSLPYQEGAGDLVAGTKGSMVAVFGQEPLNPAAQEFARAYKAKYGTDRWWGNDPERPQIFMSLSVSNAYDGADLLFEAVRRAGATDPKGIQEAMESIQGYRGVNAVYSFSSEKHHAIAVSDLAIFEYVKKDSGIKLQIAEN
jgi:branched-chain amino acid transport system substrate-binding protein